MTEKYPRFTSAESTRRVRASSTCSCVARSALSFWLARSATLLGLAATPPARMAGLTSFLLRLPAVAGAARCVRRACVLRAGRALDGPAVASVAAYDCRTRLYCFVKSEEG